MAGLSESLDGSFGESHQQLAHALGEAVVRIWSTLPHDVQHDLFEEALAASGEALRSRLAVFLHGKHMRTGEAVRARDVPEPDSLGG
jgi:hypothetical protein